MKNIFINYIKNWRILDCNNSSKGKKDFQKRANLPILHKVYGYADD